MSAPGHAPADVDAEERVELLLRDLGSSPRGLSSRQAEQRALQYGANELRRRVSRKWPREILRQVTHPLALLLWLAAALSFAVGSVTVGVAVLLVIALNAAFAFVQELEAERAVEALAAYMPPHATALRDGAPALLDARGLVPGDIVLIEEGDRIPADARLLDGSVELDVSTLTGESAPVTRSADLEDQGVERVCDRPTSSSAARWRPVGRPRRSCSRPVCTRSWDGSRHSPSGSRRSRARSRRRCGRSPG